MTNLRDLMHQTVENDHADMVRLAARARRDGTALRRRRHVAVAGGSLAVLAVLAGGVATAGGLLPGAQGPGESTAFATGSDAVPGPVIPPPDGPRATGTHSTHSGLARLLDEAIADVAAGTSSELRNTGAEYYGHVEKWGSLEFAPAGGSPAGRVAVAYLEANQVKLFPRGDRDVTECFGDMEDCEVTTLPDGSTLRTHAFQMELDELGTWEILLADRLVGDTVVHIVTDAARDDKGPYGVLAPHAPLTLEQLTQLASLPVWAS